MKLPMSVTLSKRATHHFRTIKIKTGVTNNVLARIAISLAIESGEDVEKAPREDAAGQTLDRDLLFGELVYVYETVIREYMCEHEVSIPSNLAIASLIEIGAHKMGHVRSLDQLINLS